jgi:MaoC like domain
MSVFDGLEVGQVVAERTFSLTRDSLVRYAGASGDFNSIHYRDDVAAAVGLPGVLAHGMLTMGFAVQPVIDWLDARGWVSDYQVRSTRSSAPRSRSRQRWGPWMTPEPASTSQPRAPTRRFSARRRFASPRSPE